MTKYYFRPVQGKNSSSTTTKDKNKAVDKAKANSRIKPGLTPLHFAGIEDQPRQHYFSYSKYLSPAIAESTASTEVSACPGIRTGNHDRN
jgi:hypothetical protein